MNVPWWGWIAAIALILGLVVVDLVANARGPAPTVRRSLVASAGWIAVSVAFGVVVAFVGGGSSAEQYFGAYLLEKSLSIDNVFVFALLFASLQVPLVQQRRVLYFGVVGALILRAAFIGAGAVLLEELSWATYLFGAIVVLAGARMLRGGGQDKPGGSLVLRAVSRALPVDPGATPDRFFTRDSGRLMVTSLFVALVAVEVTDITFAVDSIPAVFGVTTNVFLAFTSNAFALLGMRSLYFLLAHMLDRFRSLKTALAVVLVFIGVKMLLASVVEIPAGWNLVLIAGAIAVVAVRGRAAGSRPVPPADPTGAPSEHPHERAERADATLGSNR